MRPDDPQRLARRHLRFGWWALLAFLVLGLVLETFHGLKVGWYLDVGNSTRRLMWTLAHAHGTLVALMNLAFASALGGGWLDGASARSRRLASLSLVGANLLLPGGFFLAGFGIYAGDPGPGILLAGPGGVLLLLGVLLVARDVARKAD